MAEGVAEPSGDVVDTGPATKGRPPRPPDDPERAPNGWTWDRGERDWRPAKRRVIKRDPVPDEPDASDRDDTEVERDPEPARFADERKGRGSSSAAPSPSLSAEDRADMEAVLAFAGMLLLPPVCSIDPVCGGAAAENWEKISSALVPVIAKSSSVSTWVTKAGGLRDWLALGAALSPVGSAVLRHHVFHSIEAPDDAGAVPEEDLSAYPA